MYGTSSHTVNEEYSMMDLLILKYGMKQEFIITGKRQGEKMREELNYPDENLSR